MKNSLLKDYIHVFKIPFLLFGLLLGATILLRLLFGGGEDTGYVRGNRECTDQRVFDYADKLTDAEEAALRAKIEAVQDKIGCDIVIVILEESLEEYAKAFEKETGPLEPAKYTMVYANQFYDENGFGYNEPLGDGILLLDNWYRESDGKIHSWISPSGRVWEHYTSEKIDSLMNAFIDEVQEDTASGYELFVDMVAKKMGAGRAVDFYFAWWMILAVGAVAALIFFFVNYGGRKGKKTVMATTYVKSGRPDVRVREDVFLTKTLTKRKIPTSSGGSGRSGGGGGGPRISRGGGGSR